MGVFLNGLKSCFFGAFEEKDDLSKCDFWRSNIVTKPFSWAGLLRIYIKTMLSVLTCFYCRYFTTLYVYFVRRRTLILFDYFTADRNRTQTNVLTHLKTPSTDYQTVSQDLYRRFYRIDGCWFCIFHVFNLFVLAREVMFYLKLFAKQMNV